MDLMRYTNLKDKYGYVYITFFEAGFNVSVDTPEGTWSQDYWTTILYPMSFFLKHLGAVGCRFVHKEERALIFEFIYVDYATQHSKVTDIIRIFQEIKWS